MFNLFILTVFVCFPAIVFGGATVDRLHIDQNTASEACAGRLVLNLWSGSCAMNFYSEEELIYYI